MSGIRPKCPKTKTSQLICQNVPFLVSQNVPSIFSLYLIKLEIANISCPKVKTSQSQNVPSQNVPESKRPKLKRPKVKTSQVKMSQSQNVPSDLPKCPIFGESKRPKYIFTIFNKTRDSKHFLSQSQNAPSQNVPKTKCPKSKRPRVKTSQC